MNKCRICHSLAETRNIDLYAFGSEGVDACHACEMAIVEFIRAMSSVGGRTKLAVFRDVQRERRET